MVRVGTVWMTSIYLLASSSSVLSVQPYLLTELKVAGPGIPVPLSDIPPSTSHHLVHIPPSSSSQALAACSWCCLAAERKEHWSFWQGKEVGSTSTPNQFLWNKVSMQESKHHLSLETYLYFFFFKLPCLASMGTTDFYSLDGDFTLYEVITLV